MNGSFRKKGKNTKVLEEISEVLRKVCLEKNQKEIKIRVFFLIIQRWGEGQIFKPHLYCGMYISSVGTWI